jgi:hypothetical protein
MENKYFTPDIEDFHIGYELQLYNLTEKLWENVVLGKEIMYRFCYDPKEKKTSDEFVRVPCLTKEQIEAEGWKHTGGKLISGANQLYEKKEKYSPVIIYSTDSRKIKIEDSEGNTLLETVECKDINTFRKIIKLLGICH